MDKTLPQPPPPKLTTRHDTWEKARASKPITTGQLNKAIDIFLHPLFKTDERYIWLDGLLHIINERNPSLSVKKFFKYSVPELTKTKRKPRRKSSRPHTKA